MASKPTASPWMTRGSWGLGEWIERHAGKPKIPSWSVIFREARREDDVVDERLVQRLVPLERDDRELAADEGTDPQLELRAPLVRAQRPLRAPPSDRSPSRSSSLVSPQRGRVATPRAIHGTTYSSGQAPQKPATSRLFGQRASGGPAAPRGARAACRANTLTLPKEAVELFRSSGNRVVRTMHPPWRRALLRSRTRKPAALRLPPRPR